MYVDLEYVYLQAGKASFVFLIIFTIDIILCYNVKTIIIILTCSRGHPHGKKKNNSKYVDILKLHI